MTAATPKPIAHDKCVLSTSFTLLHEAQACESRYRHLARSLGNIREYGKDRPIPITAILETNGIDDALWALRAVQPKQKELCKKLARLFACDCVERIVYLYEEKHPSDKRPRQAMEAARKFARGEITADELAAAGDAARAAARDAARDAAEDAARAATRAAAGDATRAAAGDAARAAARAAAWDAARAAARAAARDAARDAAWDAAWDAARDAAWDAEKEFQRKRLVYYLISQEEA